jgi:hypothetical protein
MVNAKVQDHILKLLKSQSTVVADCTCSLMKALARHEPTVPAILELSMLKQLVVLAGWVIGSDIYHLVGNSMLKPHVPGSTTRRHFMPFTELVAGQMVLQFLQTWMYLKSCGNWRLR